jgi:hypothetical protein
MANTNPQITGWARNGQPIETPEGIHAEDFFAADGKYLGADEDGVEPIFVEVENEEDGRILASVPAFPGVMAYGATEAEARSNVAKVAEAAQ